MLIAKTFPRNIPERHKTEFKSRRGFENLKFGRVYMAAYCCLLFFWAISLSSLDRFPPINPDEPWILSPGYKLFSQGIYGSDLFVGFYGMEQHYFEFTPLMSLVQGAGARLYGLGIFQMRFAAVAFGALILALTFAITSDLKNASTALFAMVLLLLWQWTPSGDRMRTSGIPLVDVSRIARYDVLAALLGLGALWQFIRARKTNQPLFDFLSGLFAGLAALAHVYGAFWIIALVSGMVFDRAQKDITRFLTGVIIVWAPWLALIAANWSDFAGQAIQNGENYDMLNPYFYINNLMNESNRYSFGTNWFFVVGASIALVFLFVRLSVFSDRRARWLFVPTLLIPMLYAVVLKTKSPNYLVTLAPLFAIALAWSARHLWESGDFTRRAATAAFFVVITIQGVNAIGTMEKRASESLSTKTSYAELDDAIPQSARVIAHPQYWLALGQCDCRSFVLPFLLSNPRATTAPISFREAMTLIAPTIVLIDVEINNAFSERPTIGEQFWAFMRQHNARVLQKIRDTDGNPILVYQLDP